MSCSGLVDSSFPERAGFVLTFDDNYVEEWYTLSMLLNENNVTATFFVSNFNSLSEDKVSLLRTLNSEGFEIGAHSFSHKDPLQYLTQHTVNEYVTEEILQEIDNMSEEGFSPASFAYPYGNNVDSLDASLLQYFTLLRDVAEIQRQPLTKKINEIDEIYYSFDGSRIIQALGIDKNFNISIDDIKEAFLRAKQNNEAVVFYAHKPVSQSTAPYQIELTYIQQIISEAAALGLKSYTFSELYNN